MDPIASFEYMYGFHPGFLVLLFVLMAFAIVWAIVASVRSKKRREAEGLESARASPGDSKPERPKIAWCKHCGEEVSPEAKDCPKCGQPDPATTTMPKAAQNKALSKVGGCLLTASLVLLLLGAWFFLCR